MTRWVRACALGLSAWLLAGGGAAAGEELYGQPVTSVTISIEGSRKGEPALADLVEVRTGAPLDARGVRESIAHLFSLGRFEDVRVSADRAAGGVAVRFDLVPAHAVRRIAFKGTLGLDEDRLRQAVNDRFGLAPAAARSPDVLALLRQLYADNGYLQATMDARPVIEGDHTVLTFTIDSGPRVTLSKVTVEGNVPGSLDAARQRLGVMAHEPYDRRRVARRLSDFVAELRKRGYYEAQAEQSLVPSADRGSAELVITLDGGPHVAIVFQGDPLPDRMRDELVPIQREASVDEDLLEDSVRRIAEYFRQQGYRDARATYTRTPEGGELAIVFRVTRGPEYRVSGVTVTGGGGIPASEVTPLLRVHEGDPFVQAQLDADIAAVTDLYKRRGYAAASIAPTVQIGSGTSPVSIAVHLDVREGPRTRVGRISFTGNTAVSDAQLQSVVGSKSGEAFYQPQLTLDRDALTLQYLDRGYRTADVQVAQAFAEDRSRVDLTYKIDEGPQIFVDHVLIVGNEKTSSDTIRREVLLHPGDPLSYEAVAESQRRVSSLGLFRRVRITELEHGDETRRDLLVIVEEAPATTLGYGGGVEIARRLVRTTENSTPTERFEAAPRGFFEIGRRNLFGRNRSVNLFTRMSLRLRNATAVTNEGEEVTDFNEYRVIGTYRQPRIFGTTDFVATGFAEQGARTSFDFNRRGARAELARRLTSTLSLSARYSLERTEVFNESFSPTDEDALLIDRLFSQVRLSTFSSSLIKDTRDDPLGPASGSLIGIDGEVAARAVGSEVGFVKSFMQGFLYRKLPGKRGIIFATGARLGLAAGFARDVVELGPDGEPVIGPDGQPVVDTVDDLPASERFFAGGDTTVRGFALDQLGTPATLDANGFPLGGNAVVVLNAELRVPVWRDIGAVTFLDAGNVFKRIDDFDVGEIRGAAGFGLRYRSPIGPLRLDIGFKLDRERLPNGELERPSALFISLGQAF
jgi:outer membrane protein assembly complex protein YaeT